MKPLASLLLLLSLSGVLEPAALATARSSECCCPDGTPMCPMREGPCSFRSGCGTRAEAPLAPLTLFVPSESAVSLFPASGGDLLSQATPAAPISALLDVPHPPPRA